MTKLDQLRNDLKGMTDAALLWSGGLDSTLILATMREVNPKATLIQFREFWTRAQTRIADALIGLFGLEVYGYAPCHAYLVGEHDKVTAVFEYEVGNAVLPVLRDVTEGAICMADVATGMKVAGTPIKTETVILGTRRDDRHYAIDGEMLPAKEWTVNGTRFVAPLYDWTRDEVKAGLKSFGLASEDVGDDADTGNLAGCLNCLNGTGEVFCPKDNRMIPAVKWERSQNLELFRAGRIHNHS